MKFTKILLIGLIFFLFTGGVFGQDLTYSAAEGLFNDSQKSLLVKAEKYIVKGDKKIKLAEAIEKKYAKKKKKKKKYNKKTWEAKKFRIQAEKDYLKGYQDATTVYSELIVGADFFDDADHSESQALNNSAVSLIEDAEKKMSKLNKSVNDSKTLKKMSSSKVNSTISSARSLKEDAVDKQKEALDLVLNQGKKKEAVERDNAAWENAQSINTIEAYEDYIDAFPSGKYVSSARSMIRQLKAEQERNNQPVVSDYVFKVQIAASKTALPKYELAVKYKGTEEIEKEYVNYYYKYRVGSFPTYAQAAALRDKLLRSSAYDAFVVVFDKDGNQVEVTYDMKN